MCRYRIRYRDADDPGCPTFATVIRAHDSDHAAFLFSEDGEGWAIVGITALDRDRWERGDGDTVGAGHE